jgi:phosphate transport system substrate-binding protein
MTNTNRRITIYHLICAILLASLTACAANPATQPKSALSGTITVSGAFAIYPLMQRWADEFQKANPGVQFDISAGGAGKGMADTLAGAVDIGMISRAISKDEEAKGAYWVAIAKDAVFPDINPQNPVLQDLLAKGVKQDVFVKIFITGEIKTWGQVVNRPEVNDAIHVYTRSDAAGAADVWALFLGNKKQENLLGIGVSGDPGLVDAVAKDPLGIAYNNLSYVFDPATGKPVSGIVVLPIDSNGNGLADADEIIDSKAKASDMILQGKYPSPPARLEYLATKGKPSGLVQVFLQWLLTDGQKYVGETGYLQLPKDQLDTSLQKIR